MDEKEGLHERNHRERKEQNRSLYADEKHPAAAQVVEAHDAQPHGKGGETD